MLEDLFSKYLFQEISKDSSDFPSGFLALTDCPSKIYVIGNIELLNTDCISIVGTRYSSDYGNELSYYFAKELSTYFTIVSGMATGIDQSAHKGSFENGKTIAVLAGGLKKAITSGNEKMILKILEHGGTIVTEYPDDIPPQDFTFLERNRLIAAFSKATIVIEAPIKSGALNTALHVKNLNKPLFAVPWSLNYYKGIGCNNLLKEGAIPLIDASQILSKFVPTYSQMSLLDIENIASPKVPDEYLGYYTYIKENSPVSIEQISSFFNKKAIGDIEADLLMMELNSYIKIKDNLYYI